MNVTIKAKIFGNPNIKIETLWPIPKE